MKKSNTLKRLGLEKEFANWLVDIRKRESGFKIGDKVFLNIPNKSFEDYWKYYGVRSGSEGTIERDAGKCSIHGENKECYQIDFGRRMLYVPKNQLRRRNY